MSSSLKQVAKAKNFCVNKANLSHLSIMSAISERDSQRL